MNEFFFSRTRRHEKKYFFRRPRTRRHEKKIRRPRTRRHEKIFFADVKINISRDFETHVNLQRILTFSENFRRHEKKNRRFWFRRHEKKIADVGSDVAIFFFATLGMSSNLELILLVRGIGF